MNRTFSQDHGDTTPTCRHIAVLRRTQNFQQPLNTPEPNAGTLVSGRAFLGGRQRCHARKGRPFLSESSVFRVNEGRSSSLLIMLVPGSTHKCLTGQPTTHWLRLELAHTGLDNYRVRHPKSDAGSSNPSRPPHAWAVSMRTPPPSIVGLRPELFYACWCTDMLSSRFKDKLQKNPRFPLDNLGCFGASCSSVCSFMRSKLSGCG